MRIPRLFVFASLLATALAVQAAPVTYTMDPNHTQVLFTWNHFGFSNPTANFNQVQGTLVYDAADPAKSSVEVSMPLAGLDTHVPALDAHLKEADFFDAAKYPVVTFRSTRVEAAGPGKLKVVGDLTVHGVTRPVTLDVTINKVGTQPMWKAAAVGFDATATLKRSDFGVSQYVPMVSDQIRIHITTEAIEAATYKAKTAG
ncbi:MAG TPA: YceI family protein [Rhodanobacteraceae bacterium]|jgi:polyisoprenoid-binding protein YceI|nr:YceI family protein [Rhodanobacteraceae bacterium]